MRVLIVSDVHSNLEAFQSVIADAEARGGFDQILSLGDLVGYGPDPGACIELLRQHDHKGVAGNHDLASIGKLSLEAFNPYAAAANIWTAKQLTSEQADYLASLPLKIELDEFTVVHGSPRDPVWEYVISIEAAVASFMHFDTYWCLVGHSHIPFLCRPAENEAVFLEFPLDRPIALGQDRIIVNPGGVGQPRDGDPRASYAVYDSAAQTVTHRRVGYDIPRTQEKMRKHDLPIFLIERLAVGR
ncbi:MAG: metallophosphatase family protein [Chloroflexi bacterium]|nr:metallophosphatase family protein [Chloroflexota bacterium]